jgi:uncharacterized membrane protein (UPF0127 family)
MRRVFIALGIGALLAAGCSSDGSRPDPAAEARIATSGGDVTLHVAVAETGEARARGLQGVADLPADHGMAFLFEEPSSSAFWMKDTEVPLSIAFWGSDGRILDLMDMTPCTADPCPTYRPDASYVGALEANRGFFAEHGVEVGDRVAIVR